MNLSAMLQTIEPQLARRLFEKAKQYHNVIDLTLGDPDFDTPDNVRKAGCEAIMAGKTKYTANAGIMELREAISDDIYNRLGVRYDPKTEIVCTIGAMGALYLATLCTLNPGDEMIILAPHWPNYTNMVKMCYATPLYVNIYGKENIAKLDANIRSVITEKTKAIILNTPSNPTGQLLEEEHLKVIAAIAKEYNLTVFADEVYHSIIFHNKEHKSIIQLPDMKDNTILIDSLSKRYSMTGWRVGFAAADASIVDYMVQLNEDVAACVPMFAQYAAIEALHNGNEAAAEMTEKFHQRCKFLTDKLGEIDKLRCPETKGTFYLMVDISATGLSSEEFAYGLLEKEQVAVVPGNAFHACGEGYIRIACTLDIPILETAAEKIKHYVDNL